MIRAAFACGLLASIQASRIQEHSVLESKTQSKFGATCEDLQDSFHTRAAAIQESLDGSDQSEMNALARTRLMMRMHGIIRTLRRAQECSWVIENNSDDLDQMRGVVQQLIAGNPCAQAARAEMEGASEESPEGISRAIGILMSDDCEAPEMPQGAEVTPIEQLQDLEDEVQDGLDELATNSDESAFLEMDKTQRSQFLRRFFRAVGVFFLAIFFILACMSTAVIIGLFLGAAVAFFAEHILRIPYSLRNPNPAMEYQFLGLLVGGAIGVPTCIYQMATSLLQQ